MHRLVCGHDAEVAAWVASRIPHVGEAGFGPCAAIGVASDDRLLAGVVYHDWQAAHGTVQLSMAAATPMWARRENIAGLLHYPFRQLGAFKAWTCIPADNVPALKVNAHVGFRREAILAHHFGRKRHAVIMRLLLPEYLRQYGA